MEMALCSISNWEAFLECTPGGILLPSKDVCVSFNCVVDGSCFRGGDLTLLSVSGACVVVVVMSLIVIILFVEVEMVAEEIAKGG